MNRKRFALFALPAMLLLQNCIKEKENLIPETGKSAGHWGYEQPESWGDASGNCAGIYQSPIDINTAATIKAELPDLQFSYAGFPIAVIDNGHTIQVNTKGYDVTNNVSYKDKLYKLKQFHFHAKSEHTINGGHAPMELHMVHAADDGAILVVGLMIKEGMANDLVAKVWENLPMVEEEENQTAQYIDPDQVLPANRGYYSYMGSLTTPPCAMGLQWIVMREPLYLSTSQINTFRALYDHNYRPVQPLNRRVVYERR